MCACAKNELNSQHLKKERVRIAQVARDDLVDGLNFFPPETAKPLSSDPIQEDGDEDLVCLLGVGNTARPSIDLNSCNCAEVLASVFPQLVDHWRAAGNKLKTMRYLTESGAAALATSANMRALSYLYEVQSIIEETKANQEPLATREETARVESLIGQVICLELDR